MSRMAKHSSLLSLLRSIETAYRLADVQSPWYAYSEIIVVIIVCSVCIVVFRSTVMATKTAFMRRVGDEEIAG